MLKNYLKISLRNLRRNFGYTCINIGGLALGMACVLLIAMFVRDELRYDRFHAGADHIYRVHVGGAQEVTPTIIAPLFERALTEVEATTRIYDIGRFQPPVVQYDEHQFFEEGFYYADSTVFDVFSFPLLIGDPNTALRRPNTIVLTERVARKYFGNANPVGEVLEVGTRGRKFEVTGVLTSPPSQSHLDFDFLASFSSTSWADREIWDSANFLTYILLKSNVSLPTVQTKIEGLVAEAHANGLVDEAYALTLQPLLGIWLDFEGRRLYVLLLASIGVLILLIACINYINLATARGAMRAREVGVRKVSGAQRAQLIQQFIGESILITLLSLGLAIVLAGLVLPFFNTIVGKALALNLGSEPWAWGAVGALLVMVSLAGGGYPAFLLSSFKPVEILRNASHAGTGKSRLRRMLVIFQFAVSVILLVGTAVVYTQLQFIQTKDLGFEKEHMVVVPLGLGNSVSEVYPAFKAALLQESGIDAVAAVNHIPGYQEGGYGFWAEGVFDEASTIPSIGGVPSDDSIVETLGLSLLAGQGFRPTHADSVVSGRYQYVLNEAAVRTAGWQPDEAIGKRVALSSNRQGTVVGVIGDYHFLSLHESIEPLAYFVEPWGCNYMIARLSPGNIAQTLGRMETVWSTWLPNRPFMYTFLDDELDALYRAEQQAGSVFLMAALLAVIIACLGLFGLAAFTASKRRKEVGIRKAMGASVMQIVLLLTREFSLLVIAGFVIALPFSIWLMQQWLQNFAYKVSLSSELFLGAGILVLCIAWVTVGYQAIRAARTNPVDALRYD